MEDSKYRVEIKKTKKTNLSPKIKETKPISIIALHIR